MKNVKPLINEPIFTKEGSRKVRSYFSRTNVGQSEDYRTPLWDSRPREEILKGWDEVFEGKAKEYSSEPWMSYLSEYELEMRSKVGPLSIQAPLLDRMDGIVEYFNHQDYDGKEVDKVALAQAINNVLKEYKHLYKSIRIRSSNRTWDNMQKSTNSGAPAFSKRRTVANEIISDAAKIFNSHHYLSNFIAEDPVAEFPAILGWRGQEGGPSVEDVKQRTVWMFPAAINLCELQFYQPAIEVIQKFELIPAYVSTDAVEKRMTKLFDTKADVDLVIATDFSKMDQHFNKIMQDTAFRVVNELHTPSNLASKYMENVWPIKYYIPLILNGESSLVGYHGMASGSGGTNFDESMAHRVLQHYCAIKCNSELNLASQMLGDDGIISFPNVSVDNVVKYYTQFGQVMNPDKQFASTEATVYLRRLYHTKYRVNNQMKGIYSTYRALGKLMGQERYYDPKVWGPEMVVLRSLAIIENTANHPMFHNFIEYVMKGDKYKLGLSIPGFFENIKKRYSEAKAALPSFLSYTQELEDSGIENWKVVQYLMNKKVS